MIEYTKSALPSAAGREWEENLPAQSRLRAIRARGLVTIAGIEEATNIVVSPYLEDVDRAAGHCSAAAALAWEPPQRIGYRRRSLFNAAGPRQ